MLKFLAAGTFLLFLGLKLGGVPPVAAWSWWWVTSPMWIWLAALLAFLFLVALPLAVVKAVAEAK